MKINIVNPIFPDYSKISHQFSKSIKKKTSHKPW